MKLLETPPDQRMLDGYELVGELARGGMACVYVARRGGAGGFNRWVAVKRLDPRFASDPTYATMVLDEARLAARIHHPNVSSILEIGGGPDRPAADGSASLGDYYMVMEYVEGCTLAQLVERVQQGSDARPLARRVVLRIVLDVLAGLQAAHELTDDHGVAIDLVHRDCTPHNILVGANGNTRIADFGLARAAARLTKTEVGTLKGKLAYMTPEQVNDGPIDRRTDLFTVGIVLWEALTGQRLFRAENELATLERILRAPIARLSTFIPSISTELEDVCARALQRNPERRFASAAKMADAIEAAAAASTGREGGVASRREVATEVNRLFGTELSLRRELLRSRLSDRFEEQRLEERRSSEPPDQPGRDARDDEGERPGDRPSVTTITMSYDGEPIDADNFVFDAHFAARRRQKWTRGMLTAAAGIGLVTLIWAGATHLSSRFDHSAIPADAIPADAIPADAIPADDLTVDGSVHAAPASPSFPEGGSQATAGNTPRTDPAASAVQAGPPGTVAAKPAAGLPGWQTRGPRSSGPWTTRPAPRPPVVPSVPTASATTGGASAAKSVEEPTPGDCRALPPNELSNPYR